MFGSTFTARSVLVDNVWLYSIGQTLSNISGSGLSFRKNKLNKIWWNEFFCLPLYRTIKQKIMSNLKEQEVTTHWTKVAKEVLEGKTIVEVRYLNDEEMEMMGWYKRPICFFLDNGTNCILSCDDEGNDGGVLFYGQNGVLPTL